MRVLRYTCILCLVFTLFGCIAIMLLPVVMLEEQFYECFLGLLTGLISGAFLATATSCCELIVKIRRQRKLLYEFVYGLSACLRQMSISFIVSQDQNLSPKLFAPNLGCMKGPGLQFANLMCSEIDEDLFALNEKSKALNVLRGMASVLGPQIYRMDCQCKILANKAQMHDLNQQTSFSFEVNVDVSRKELENEVKKFVNDAVSLSDKAISDIEDQICVLFGEKKLEIFHNRLEEEIAGIVPQINEIIKGSTLINHA